MTKAILLTPQEVRDRLSVVTTDFETVLKNAEVNGLKVIYYYNATPFGTFPICIELDDRAAEVAFFKSHPELNP